MKNLVEQISIINNGLLMIFSVPFPY